MLDKLLEKGLNLNEPVQGFDNVFWLEYAITNTYNDVFLKYLLEKGAWRCKKGIHPYAAAVEMERSKEVISLIENLFDKGNHGDAYLIDYQ